ncbi:MAG TPA: 6-carboxytetrahydropterin synthase [Actinomycetota bacterium]|nr:6-carboxytetrahydropterin synthase [Actinomycetota bacterium]
MPIRVTRRETFNAGHTLRNPEFSDERNLEVFGKCSNPGGHGHNYVLEVTLEQEVDPRTGYVFDLRLLSELIEKHVLADLDHRNLNTDVEWLRGRIPTTEILADAIWDRLEPHLPPGSLHSVRVRETEKNWVERCRG